jgi:phage-related protein
MQKFPQNPRIDLGDQNHRIQTGQQPTDFKPMPSVGSGVEEIRVRDTSGAYRVIYTARLAEAVYVLHAFQKKTRATSKPDIEVARARFAELIRSKR